MQKHAYQLEQYTALEQGYLLFKEQLADKKLEYRQQLDLLIQQAADVLSAQSGNMSPMDESYLNELLIYRSLLFCNLLLGIECILPDSLDPASVFGCFNIGTAPASGGYILK